jgi:hypothetical protein
VTRPIIADSLQLWTLGVRPGSRMITRLATEDVSEDGWSAGLLPLAALAICAQSGAQVLALVEVVLVVGDGPPTLRARLLAYQDLEAVRAFEALCSWLHAVHCSSCGAEQNHGDEACYRCDARLTEAA